MSNDGDPRVAYSKVEYLLNLDRKRTGREIQEKVLNIQTYIDLIQKDSESQNINNNIIKLKSITDSLHNYCILMQSGF